ncbi:MAG: phosphotransferase [Planctomycetota bacterium]
MTQHPLAPGYDEAQLLRSPDKAAIANFAQACGWLGPGEEVLHVDKAGEGNMNLVVRVATNRRTAILKQSRPWVEKFPHIAAPALRIRSEQAFYERVADLPDVAGRMPRVLSADPDALALWLEDLGEASDFTTLYQGGALRDEEVDTLAHWSAALHRGTRGPADPAFANRGMRRLNHAHVFALPLTETLSLRLDDLEPGLADAASLLRRDTAFTQAVQTLGQAYLSDGACLLHGDNYPGSWLRTAQGVRVIDPEFGFYGPPEFDAAVAVAHFALAGLDLQTAERWLGVYRDAAGCDPDPSLLAGFAGVEVMRRLIGLAQLPLEPRGAEARPRVALLGRARQAVLSGRYESLWAE